MKYCAVCGTELYNEFSIYCSKMCKDKVENPIQKTELVSLTEKIPNKSFSTELSRQESNGEKELNINVNNLNVFQQESEFAPYLRDEPNFGLALLGFFFPIVGLIVYFIIKEEKPRKAGSCIKGVIWGVVFSVVFGFMYFTWLNKQYKEIDRQYKIEMQQIDKEYEKMMKELKRYGY